MKQRVKICETGATCGKRSQIGILYSAFIVGVFEYNDDHAVEVMRLGAGGRTLGFLALAFRRLSDLRLILRIGCLRSDALSSCVKAGAQDKGENRYRQ